MVYKIKLQRDKSHNIKCVNYMIAVYNVVNRKPKLVEYIGSFNQEKKKLSLRSIRFMYWMSIGSQMSNSLLNLFKKLDLFSLLKR